MDWKKIKSRAIKTTVALTALGGGGTLKYYASNDFNHPPSHMLSDEEIPLILVEKDCSAKDSGCADKHYAVLKDDVQEIIPATKTLPDLKEVQSLKGNEYFGIDYFGPSLPENKTKEICIEQLNKQGIIINSASMQNRDSVDNQLENKFFTQIETQIKALNPLKPIGIVMYDQDEDPIISPQAFSNATRNNLIKEMSQQYGGNIVVIDDASPNELRRISKFFNTQFSSPPEVHFAFRAHFGTIGNSTGYAVDGAKKLMSEKELCSFFESIQAKEKRAVILACGPTSDKYHLKGFDCVLIPAPDGTIEVTDPVNWSLEWKPNYSNLISLMRNNGDPEVIRNTLKEDWFDNAKSYIERQIAKHNLSNGAKMLNTPTPDQNDNPPIVVTPLPTPGVFCGVANS